MPFYAQFVTLLQQIMRGLGGLQAFYYLQTLLTGDTETRRKPALLLSKKRYKQAANKL